ncbi:MAG: helicase-related protein [Merdibacter sp.]
MRRCWNRWNGELKQVTLFERPHRHPLVIPEVWRTPAWLLHIGLLQFLVQNHRAQKQTLVFVPTIRMAQSMGFCYRLCFSCASLSSKSTDRDALLERFRKKELEVLFATTVLERGITIPDVQVAVFHSEHPVFTAASLIQMIGRAGRKKEHPDGRGRLLCTYVTKEQSACSGSWRR